MNKIIMSMALAALAVVGAEAQNYTEYGISDISVTRPNEQTLKVTMSVNPRQCHMSYRKSATITPVIRATKGNDEVRLPSITMAGKNAYYYLLRDQEMPNLFKAGRDEATGYSSQVAFQPWMIHSQLVMEVENGCCGNETTATVPMANLDYAKPTFDATNAYEYVQPQAVGSKLFNESGSAFVNFVIGKSAIEPNFKNNAMELQKILTTINAVRDNKDAKVKKIELKGYASPDGPYATNVRLAESRTVALKDYVRAQYAFPENLYVTSTGPIDWDGLIKTVSESSLSDKDEIVEFLKSGYPVEKRNDQLRKLFPSSYRYLLENVYPPMRRTDYVVDYEVRKYTDVNEIREVMKTHPQNLSLNEFFLLSQSYDPGTAKYNEVFDVAVKYYPKDPVANINAAISAMNRGDLKAAEKYLRNAGNSSDANYARGLLAAQKGNYPEAISYLKSCNNPKAAGILKQIDKIQNYKGAVEWIK